MRETILYVLIILAAALTRFWALGGRTMSFDESLHAYFSWLLHLGKGYSHNPITHGPFLFHANALIFWLAGASDFTARILPAVFGVILVFLPYYLRRWLGKSGALATSFLFLISPSILYYSRYLRNDIYIAAWTLLMLIAMLKYLENFKAGWLYLGAVALGLSLSTKETTLIFGFILTTFILLSSLWEKLRQKGSGPVLTALSRTKAPTIIICLAIIALIFIPLHTTFLTNLNGLKTGTIGAVSHWLAVHPARQGEQPWHYYLFLLSFYEFLPLILGLAGSGYYIYRQKLLDERARLFSNFLIYWWVLALIIYSWAGEKMPWLMLHILLPMILLAGRFAGEVMTSFKWKKPAVIGLIILSLLTIRASWQANFIYQDSPKELLAFAQGNQDIRSAMALLQEISDQNNLDRKLRIAIDSDSAWPFEWYLRTYPNKLKLGSGESIKELNAGIIIVSPRTEDNMKSLLVGDRFEKRNLILLSWPIKFYRRPIPPTVFWEVFWQRHYNFPPDFWPNEQPFILYIRKELCLP